MTNAKTITPAVEKALKAYVEAEKAFDIAIEANRYSPESRRLDRLRTRRNCRLCEAIQNDITGRYGMAYLQVMNELLAPYGR
jgi:hypothetical protein